MTKDPEDYAGEHPGAYDHYAWYKSDHAMSHLDTRINVWVIFQEYEFWTLYEDERCR